MKYSIYALPLNVVDVSTLSHTYDRFYLEKIPCLVTLRITNQSNIPVMISFDGVHDHDIVPAFGFLELKPLDNTGFFKTNSYYIRSGSDKKGDGKTYVAIYVLYKGA